MRAAHPESPAGYPSLKILGIFLPWRLQAYGYTLAAFYACVYFFAYHYGVWLVDGKGTPLFSDFAAGVWLTGGQALHGQATTLYDPSYFIGLQKVLLGPSPFYYPNWPYPPIFLLIAVPFGALPFVTAFVSYELLALLGSIDVIALIVRRRAAIALVLASPYTAWNIGCGQGGLLTAALFGAALLALERRPVLSGIFIGCLTYKPQLGILVPVALVAAREWRAIASAVATTIFLIGLSALALGVNLWAAFPGQLAAQFRVVLLPGAGSHWGMQETVYGMVHYLGFGDSPAWIAHAITSLAAALMVWILWRSRVRYAVKAAALSAAALAATPYAFAYDMAVLAVPIAFLARDQIDQGCLRGEQTALLVLSVAGLAVFPTSGSVPIGVVIVFALLGLILRRAVSEHIPAREVVRCTNCCEDEATCRQLAQRRPMTGQILSRDEAVRLRK
jgi:arabinofuranan 3-O-arabinosyltransferase